jgi:hypothetical protein
LLARQNGATYLDFAKNAVLAITISSHQTKMRTKGFLFNFVKKVDWLEIIQKRTLEPNLAKGHNGQVKKFRNPTRYGEATS